MCNYEKYNKGNIKRNKIFETTYYRSFINKILIHDKTTDRIITKPMEGSSDIFAKNNFNLETMTILNDKNLYEKIMSNPLSLRNHDIQVPEYYFQLDYPFPNLNFMTYSFGNKEERINRINKMYYCDDCKNWYKLLIN